MGIKIRKTFLLTSICVFFCFKLNAQDQQSLKTVLVQIEEQFAINFNYAEDAVKDIVITTPKQSQSLDTILQYLQNETGLVFIKMSENVVLIQVKNDLSLCGYLRDKDTNTPIPFATIKSLNISTITDDNGFFNITVANENNIIEIRHIGYKTMEQSLKDFKQTKCSDVFLQPDIEVLSEIVLSNYIVNGITKINDGSFKIDFKNFDILPGLIDTDVLQAVQAFPGIISSNETVSNINIRGGTNDQNLILWDGIKMYQSGHFFGLISMYNPQITERVYLKKNGTGSDYTDGVSGSILMETAEKVNTEFKGNIGVNLIDVNGFVDVALSSKSSIQVAARKSISDIVQTPLYKAYFDRISQDTELVSTTSIVNSDQEFNFYDTSLRWIYNISDKDELRVNFINVANQLKFNESALIDVQSTSKESSLSQNSIAAAIHYKRQWNTNFSSDIHVYETDYKLKSINVNILDSQRFLQENKISETSIKLNTNYAISEHLNLLNGYQFVETQITNLDDVDLPVFRILISEVVRTHGLYSEVNYKSPNKNTSLNGGLRYNYIGKLKKSILEPRLSFNQRLSDHFSLEVLAEFKHQNTSQIINFQNDFLGVEKRRWQLSNDIDIPILRSKQISTGLSFSKKGWLLSLDGYYKFIDGITSQSQGFQNQYQFIRANGSYDVKGLDMLLRKQFKTFNTWLSYAYMSNNYTFNSLESNPFPSNLDITHAIAFGAAYSKNQLKISSGLNWHSGNPTTRPVPNNDIINNAVNFGPTNTSSVRDYLRLDVSATYDFYLGQTTKANIGLSIWNLLDRENQINNFYRINNDVVNETIQRSLGITPNLSFRVYF
ncbi:carboxypeptidase-like regulatory domain-containing protein [Ichthyenterobacterium sp. W332]|uniref:Carboxypeptidase-like regulatory domain-containing protein n=1 Tax=Microcosmobacter mediterraneus TaxID=3075607 RepID=A0ABU2YJ29_9FLAO|nr:carboxypeptidase-like regulatory domain-containing protein [Ichthyenterobacterium sp. W332]MDT0558168.1 carboxypeptidase-like regulatory domain-containing protein [Ichthyenterobacterium sp. W332]